MKRALPFVIVLSLAGCEAVRNAPADTEPKSPVAEWMAGTSQPAPPPSARTVEEFDTTTEAQRVAAAATSSGGTLLGTEIASLGDPTRPGFWIETALVSEPATGRLVYPATGKSAEVELLPGTGGARVSLAALRLLDAPLTDLPTLEIYRN